VEKSEIKQGVENAGLWNRYRNEHWWRVAFEAYNKASGSNLKPTCGRCFGKVKEWLER